MDSNEFPAELLRQKNWLIRKGKYHKSIYRADWRQWNEPSCWATGEEALRCVRATSFGLSFHFTRECGFFGIDIDSCRDPETGEIEIWARRIVDVFKSYTEISLSASGLHIVGIGATPGRSMYHVLGASHGNHEPNVEVFEKKPLAMTGRVFEQRKSVAVCSTSLIAFYDLMGRWCRAGFAKRQGDLQNDKPAVVQRQQRSNDRPEIIDEFNRTKSIRDLLSSAGYSVVGKDRLLRPGKSAGGENSHSVTIRVGSDGIERATFWSSNCHPFVQSHAGCRAATYDAFTIASVLQFGQPELSAKRQFMKEIRRQRVVA